MNIIIYDRDGQPQTITDLAAAIEQARAFARYKVEGPAFDQINKERQLYWTDLLQKLLAYQKGHPPAPDQ